MIELSRQASDSVNVLVSTSLYWAYRHPSTIPSVCVYCTVMLEIQVLARSIVLVVCFQSLICFESWFHYIALVPLGLIDHASLNLQKYLYIRVCYQFFGRLFLYRKNV